MNTIVVTSPKEARTILRNYLRDGNNKFVPVKNRRARFAALSDISSHMQKTTGKPLDLGWFGRSLNSIEDIEIESIDSKSKVYRVNF